MKEMTIPARPENLYAVLNFIKNGINEAGCPVIDLGKIELAVEEIFVNISSYAYIPGYGDVKVRWCMSDAPGQVIIQFLDDGKPFNPLLKNDPDMTLNHAEREVGGLGIFILKKICDRIDYEYVDGKNSLTLWMNIG